MSDIDTVVVDSLKALDPERPIREADIGVGRKGSKWAGRLSSIQNNSDLPQGLAAPPFGRM